MVHWSFKLDVIATSISPFTSTASAERKEKRWEKEEKVREQSKSSEASLSLTFLSLSHQSYNRTCFSSSPLFYLRGPAATAHSHSTHTLILTLLATERGCGIERRASSSVLLAPSTLQQPPSSKYTGRETKNVICCSWAPSHKERKNEKKENGTDLSISL